MKSRFLMALLALFVWIGIAQAEEFLTYQPVWQENSQYNYKYEISLTDERNVTTEIQFIAHYKVVAKEGDLTELSLRFSNFSGPKAVPSFLFLPENLELRYQINSQGQIVKITNFEEIFSSINKSSHTPFSRTLKPFNSPEEANFWIATGLNILINYSPYIVQMPISPLTGPHMPNLYGAQCSTSFTESDHPLIFKVDPIFPYTFQPMEFQMEGSLQARYLMGSGFYRLFSTHHFSTDTLINWGTYAKDYFLLTPEERNKIQKELKELEKGKISGTLTNDYIIQRLDSPPVYFSTGLNIQYQEKFTEESKTIHLTIQGSLNGKE